MIPVDTSMKETNTLTGRKEVEFSIADPRWVMRSMADLYSNRELAVIREYSTNAWDAHREAGNSAPIEVTLPSLMNPYFVVQDRGIGMSLESLEGTYTKFGDSTKRDSNDYNGMMGFGSKSAVAYTNTFTVTSVKDGRKSVAIISRKPDFSITLQVLSDTRTDEPNGTQIKIPVHNHEQFRHVANDFYSFWLPGRVLVNGKQPEAKFGEKIDDGMYLSPNGESYVVMGNVPYRISNANALFRNHSFNPIAFIMYVDNGKVEFTPNREALKYSDHTKDNLQKIIDNFVTSSIKKAQDSVTNATTPAESLDAYLKWRGILGQGAVRNLKYKGKDFPVGVPVDGYHYNTQYSRGNTWRVSAVSIDSIRNAVFVTEFVNNLSAAHKKRAREWAAKKGLNARVFVFTQADSIKSEWVLDSHVVDWETLKEETPQPKKVRASGYSTKKNAGSFDMFTRKGIVYEKDVPNTKELWYADIQYAKDFGESGICSYLDYFKEDVQVVRLPANRRDKFMRIHPHAQPVTKLFERHLQFDGPSLITDGGKKFLRIHERDRSVANIIIRNMRYSVPKPIDRELLDMVELYEKYKDDYKVLERYRQAMSLAKALGFGSQFKEFRVTRDPAVFADRYPLLNNYANARDNIEYINALYEYNRKKANV